MTTPIESESPPYVTDHPDAAWRTRVLEHLHLVASGAADGGGEEELVLLIELRRSSSDPWLVGAMWSDEVNSSFDRGALWGIFCTLHPDVDFTIWKMWDAESAEGPVLSREELERLANEYLAVLNAGSRVDTPSL